MYSTPALLGAACYVLLYRLRSEAGVQIPPWLGASVPFLLALFVRAAAWTYRLALPHWARKQSSLGELLLHGDQAPRKYKVELAPAPLGDGSKK